MKVIKIYSLVLEVYNALGHLVEPCVIQDVREERSKLLEVMELLKEEER